MSKPDHDKMIVLIRQHFNEDARRLLTFTRWKDGIDVQYPTYAIEALAVGAYAVIPQTARTLAEWHEDFGPVLWWFFPVSEAPWVGSPGDSDWLDDYYAHWTPLPAVPVQPST